MKRRIELQPEMTNILDLDQPQDYRCRVVGYVLERSLMGVEVAHADQTLYIIFPDVNFYDGVFLWQGASLRVASRDEQFEYMLEKSIVSAVGLLFVFDTADTTIRLFAGEWVAILDELPARFK